MGAWRSEGRGHHRLGIRSRVTPRHRFGPSAACPVGGAAPLSPIHRRQTSARAADRGAAPGLRESNLVRAALAVRGDEADNPPLLAPPQLGTASRAQLGTSTTARRWSATSLQPPPPGVFGREDAIPAHLRSQVIGGAHARGSQRCQASPVRCRCGGDSPITWWRGLIFEWGCSRPGARHTLRILAPHPFRPGSVARHHRRDRDRPLGPAERALRPLGDVAHAAVAIAGGRRHPQGDLRRGDWRHWLLLKPMADRLRSGSSVEAERLTRSEPRVRSPLTTIDPIRGCLELGAELPDTSRKDVTAGGRR